MPVLFVNGDFDQICSITANRQGDPMRAACPNLILKSMPAGHWLPLERKPELIQAILAQGPRWKSHHRSQGRSYLIAYTFCVLTRRLPKFSKNGGTNRIWPGQPVPRQDSVRQRNPSETQWHYQRCGGSERCYGRDTKER